jgi:hypothetical protein
MIIWLNGPFGAGKTTLAAKLRERRPDLLLFDPEEIGYVVKATVPPAESGDYQDLPLWRGLTLAALAELRRHYRQDIVVPMTLVRSQLSGRAAGRRPAYRPRADPYLPDAGRGRAARPARAAGHASRSRPQCRDPALAAGAGGALPAARDGMPPGTLVLDSGVHGPDALADKVIAATVR